MPICWHNSRRLPCALLIRSEYRDPPFLCVWDAVRLTKTQVARELARNFPPAYKNSCLVLARAQFGAGEKRVVSFQSFSLSAVRRNV
jgi:hypothetical protein